MEEALQVRTVPVLQAALTPESSSRTLSQLLGREGPWEDAGVQLMPPRTGLISTGDGCQVSERERNCGEGPGLSCQSMCLDT